MKLTGERKPPPSGVRLGSVADVTARQKEPSPLARSVKAESSRSKFASIVRDTDQPAQRVVLFAGAFAIALVILFPPWNFVFTPPSGAAGWSRSERFAGYHLIFGSNEPQDVTALGEMFNWKARSVLNFTTVKLDSPRLFAQLAGILCVTALCFFAVRRRMNIPHSDLLPTAWLDEKCPVDGAPLVRRRSGEFVLCSNYPKCKYIEPDIPP